MSWSSFPFNFIILLSICVGCSAWCFYNDYLGTDDIFGVNYSPDGSKIVIASKNGDNYIINARNMQVEYPYVSRKCFSAKYSPDGNYIAFGYDNSTVIVLDNSYNFVADLTSAISEIY